MAATARLMAYLGMDVSDFHKGIDGAQKKTASFGNTLALGGRLFGAYKLVQFGKEALEYASNMSDLASAFSISAESLQVYSRVADMAGVETDQMMRIIARLQEKQTSARNGNKTDIETFKKLGLSLKDIASVDTEQTLTRVGSALKSASNDADKLSAIYDLLGTRVGPKMSVALQEIALGANTLKNKYNMTIISEQQIHNVDMLTDAIADMKKELMSISFDVLGKIFRGSSLTPQSNISVVSGSARRAAEMEAKNAQKQLEEDQQKTDKEQSDQLLPRIRDLETQRKEMMQTARENMLMLEQQLDNMPSPDEAGISWIERRQREIDLREAELKYMRAQKEVEAQDKEEAEKYIATMEQADKIAKETALEQMDDANKRLEIEKRINEIKAKQAGIEGTQEYADLQVERARLESSLARIQPEKVTKRYDDLTRIGGGAGGNPNAPYFNKQQTTLDKMREDLKKIATYAAEKKGATF